MMTDRIAKHPRVVAVEHRPAVGFGDPGTTDFTSASWSRVSMPCMPEVVGADVGDDRDVVAGQPDALEQDAAARGLGDRELDLRVREHPAGAAGTRSSRRPRPARRRRRCRRWWTSRRSLPAVRAMWPIIREVVVLPLVPVTAMTGIRGLSVVGRSPASAAATRSAAALTAVVDVAAGSASSTVGDGLGPAPGRGRGGATGRRRRPGAGRGRPHPHGEPRACPTSAAICRTSRATARAANRCRKPDSAAPGRALRSPIRRANRAAVSSGAARSALRSRVSLIAARGK